MNELHELTGVPQTAETSEATREPAPAAVSFFERFLDEHSIKWMLGLGMLVLLGSSLKFVTDHWESYSPFWKYLVLIAYTAVMYGSAEIGLHRLALKRTGTGLLALTLSFLPLTFLALRWVAPELPTNFAALAHDAGLATLLVANIAFTAFASRRILQTLLRQVPTTYWLAYLTLCIAGALLPAVPDNFAFVAGLALWGVFTAGVVKVNRHVFWLAEEDRWPRIFSFFPTLLLAAQFLTVFTLNLATAISTPWLGFGLVLVAIPILMTADAVAAVFQQRTGQIVYPWPAEIVLPLVLGLVCCAAGLCLALADLPRPMAFVPTALLAAGCLAAVTRRTGQQAFAWATLLCLLAAYQFSPVYFKEVILQVRDASARAVHEQRLPYAFYGITYAPFILGLLVASRWLKSSVFAAPCRQLSIVLATVMLVASWTHPKAVFLAGITLTALWTVLRFGYRDRRLTWAAGISWMSAAFGLRTFIQEICLIPVPPEFTFWAVTGAAAVLWLVDRAVQIVKFSLWRPTCSVNEQDGSMHCEKYTIPAWVFGASVDWTLHPDFRHGRFAVGPMGRPGDFAVTLRGGPLVLDRLELISVVSAILLTASWIVQFGFVVSTAGTGLIVAILALLALHQLQRAYPVVGEFVLVTAVWAALRYGIAMGITGEVLLLAFVAGIATIWALARALEPVEPLFPVSAFRLPALRVTTVSLVLTQLLVLVALAFFSHGFPDSVMVLLAAGTVTLWGFVAAGRSLPIFWVPVACLSVLLVAWRALCCVATEPVANEWCPLLWAAVVVVGAAVSRRIARTSRDDVTIDVAHTVDQFAFAAELLLTFGTLAWLTLPARFAALLTIGSLVLRTRRASHPYLRDVLVEVGFLQVLAFALQLVTPATMLWDVSNVTWRMVQLPGTFLAAGWLLARQSPTLRRLDSNSGLLNVFVANWRLVVIASLAIVPIAQHGPLSGMQMISLIGAFAALAAEQFQIARQRVDVERVWCGLGLIGVCLGYLAWFDVYEPFATVAFGSGIMIACVLSFVARRCQRSVSTAVFADPFERVGYWLPAAMAFAAITQGIFGTPALWIGTNSLVVLAAAACYFVRWIELRDTTSLTIATAIFNASQMLLWNELSWTDPQLYLMPLGLSLIAMVEGLPRELRPELKVALRYVGALVILVSPLFHMLDGDWLPLLTLMAASLAVSVLSLGLRSRPLLYTGTAFLVADLIALVVRGSLERTDVLWIAGIGLGTAVIALAAYCENHRESVLQRMRFVAATLQTWE